MSIRIERIKVNRGGPLEEDFKLETGDINLIYGHNETGKTYIVESIINLLFRTGRKSIIDWNLRDWDFSGNIIVSGLQENPVTFSKTGRKLEDYWEETIGLPQDFSRLLVVKEGETFLSDQEDGIGRDILKNYLSGEGLLDSIQAKITSTLQEASIQNGQIVGSNRGELKKRDQLSDERGELDKLIKQAEDGYVSGEVYTLRQKQETIKAELEMLEKARRYYAFCLHGKRESLREERDNLPSEDDLSKIDSDISVYENKKNEVDVRSDALKSLEDKVESYRWADKALNIYREITGGQALARPRPTYFIIALIFLAGATVAGFLKLDIPLAICAVVSFVFSILYFFGVRRALAIASSNKELERLKAEFKKRYGSELTDRALIEAQVEKLKEEFYRATGLKKDLEEDLIPDLKIREGNITGNLRNITDNELSPKKWRLVINELRSKLSGLNSEINSIDVMLASLGVAEEDLLDQNPGVEWDSKGYNTLKEELTAVEGTLDQKIQSLEHLRTRIIQETRLESVEWDELIAALSNVRNDLAEQYRLLTAEILAKVYLNMVIMGFREEENTRIATGLESKELSKPLYAITGRYKSIKHETGLGLTLITDEGEEYPLTNVSTGAREQAFLAMRIGFSSIVMKGQTAFLILDDAFQHSDWFRRSNLLDQIVKLVKIGWQVFYFTMDDHIRDLFLNAGAKMGDKFRSSML